MRGQKTKPFTADSTGREKGLNCSVAQQNQLTVCLCFASDFQSFYNVLKNCRGHLGEQSVFSERTEESSAVQYFQVTVTHSHTLSHNFVTLELSPD